MRNCEFEGRKSRDFEFRIPRNHAIPQFLLANAGGSTWKGGFRYSRALGKTGRKLSLNIVANFKNAGL